MKKPHRFRPGTVALDEIRKYQKISFFSSTSTSTFYCPSGHLDAPTLHNLLSPSAISNDRLTDWFSSCRKTQLRPSIREGSITSALAHPLSSSEIRKVMIKENLQRQSMDANRCVKKARKQTSTSESDLKFSKEKMLESIGKQV